jgi:hypothetical protein
MAVEPAFDGWVVEVETALGVQGTADARAILDLVREVAHQVERPAGPLSAFLVGVAVGRGTHTLTEATAAVERLLAARAGS